MEKKWVYSFLEGKKEMKDLLGGKGVGLCEMTHLGIRVPPGYIISTETCEYFYANGETYPEELIEQQETHQHLLEKNIGRTLGDTTKPLLVAVRSGAAASMPGMMDTVLNLGLNDLTVNALAKETNNPRFAYDAYRRFITMFSDIVLGIDREHFEHELTEIKKEKNYSQDTDLQVEDLQELTRRYKELVKLHGKQFPQDPQEQLWMAIKAVFLSWNSNRANAYRRIHNINGLKGTAVTIIAMVFGNMGNTSGTGVAFTRDPSNGEKKIFGEYLPNAQGEDVVAGIRTPQPISTLKETQPKVYTELERVHQTLEHHYKDMQDIEFTVEQGTIYILQCRSGKRTAHAAIKIAVDMVNEGLIDKKTALQRINPTQLDQLLHKQIDTTKKQQATVIGKGLPASPGAAVGQAVFDAETAKEWVTLGKKVILVRQETCPEDIEGMHAAAGILTSRGGATSHAAVIARGMGKCCVCGATNIAINDHTRTLENGDMIIKEGDWITLDGTEGTVYQGALPLVDPQLSPEYFTLMSWADQHKKMQVRANADTPEDARKAITFGAQGIGLCRTEHMFFQEERIRAVREMILATDEENRKKALSLLLPMQREDFVGIFSAMTGKPVTIRLLDPPLHEFLPHDKTEWGKISIEMGVKYSKIKKTVQALSEINPMLGFRGCRLGVVYPEINQMQVRAIMEAACIVKRNGGDPIPEIEVPLIGMVNEAKHLKNIIRQTAEEVLLEQNMQIPYTIGTMIELPRACIRAGELAEHMEFFSFGTNDLTQTTLGISRDDSGSFVPQYIEKGIFKDDPFQVLDQGGVGVLMQHCISSARKVKPGLIIGICGEHGGEATSVKFCHTIGLNYVSCSPFRIPIARLAAAQAAIE